MASDACDPLKPCSGLYGIGCVGIECRAGGNTRFRRACGSSGAGSVEERIETARLDDGGACTRIGKHVRGGGDDGIRTRRCEFDPVGEIETTGDEVGYGLFSVLWP